MLENLNQLRFNLNQSQDLFENRFYGLPKMSDIPREIILFISALRKCLIYAVSENSAYDKALSKPPHLPNVFVFFINLDYFPIIEKGISFHLDAG